VSLEQEGALFGQVAAAEAKATERRRQEQLALEQKQKAEQAQAEMNENMRLLQQRGIQIDEMDDKAHQLSEGGKNFADMAAQLKQKTKAQRSWLPFS
jgi:N-dimethylarginine dimethylaminohydrolase